MWQTGIDETRATDYDEFADRRSRPMFHRHDGLLGVLLLGPSTGRRSVVTVWRDRAAAEALEASDDYRQTVAAITAAGFLRPPQRVQIFEFRWPE